MFHLWPQGRIVRIAVIALAVIMAADLATGCVSGFQAARDIEGSGARRQIVLGVFYGLLSLAALLSGLIAAGPHKKAVGFLIEVQDEMTKVEWPKPGELWRRTLVVALAIAVIAGIVLLTDLALYGGLEFIQKGGSR